MRIASPVRFAQRHPVIVSVEFAAIAATFWWWSGGDVNVLIMDRHAWHGELWRPFSSCLPHVDPIHLVFNLYWLTVFGSRVETTFGSLATAFWLLVFAGGSSVADYALAESGVGLSGVGYGLFAFVWILSKCDSRFHDAMPPPIAPLFVAWFFLCIGLTYADVWRVANVAHGAGAAYGVLAGLVMSPPQGHRREAAAAALLVMLVVALAAGIFARPYINFTDAAGWELAQQAYDALERKENQRAVELLERAVRSRHTLGDWWHNLGVAYDRTHRPRDAVAAYRRAVELDPKLADDPETAERLADPAGWDLAEQAYDALEREENERAVELLERAVRSRHTPGDWWHNLGIAYDRTHRPRDAAAAFRRAAELDPELAEDLETAEWLEANEE